MFCLTIKKKKILYKTHMVLQLRENLGLFNITLKYNYSLLSHGRLLRQKSESKTIVSYNTRSNIEV